MPVQNSDSEMSAHPDLQLRPEDGLLEKYFGYYPQKVLIKHSSYKFCLSKNEVSGNSVQKTGWTGPG